LKPAPETAPEAASTPASLAEVPPDGAVTEDVSAKDWAAFPDADLRGDAMRDSPRAVGDALLLL
jgi:hypothetical protein